MLTAAAFIGTDVWTGGGLAQWATMGVFLLEATFLTALLGGSFDGGSHALEWQRQVLDETIGTVDPLQQGTQLRGLVQGRPQRGDVPQPVHPSTLKDAGGRDLGPEPREGRAHSGSPFRFSAAGRHCFSRMGMCTDVAASA